MGTTSRKGNFDATETIFNEKREELLGLLDKANNIVNELSKTGDFPLLSQNLRSRINATRQRCHEGLFSIALIAAFQSGKSTTLNAFADGREIAPRGLGGGGIKTSACLVKVHNPNNKEPETVKVTWRSEQNLLQRLEEILGTIACEISNSQTAEDLKTVNQKIDKATNSRDKEQYTREYYSILDFKNSRGKALLEQALKAELELYSQSESKGSLKMQDKEDLLRFAIIVLAYHDDLNLKKLQQKDDFKPEEMENYLKFPENFVARWNKCFNNFADPLRQVRQEFSVEEVIYAFIEEVTYVVNSENLQKSGAQIVDCPGLFASSYDTLVARGAMNDASAILFLLSGDKQLSESDIKVLNLIKEIGVKEKVFFGINYKKALKRNEQEEVSDIVIQTILDQLEKLGFTASYQVQPLYFNAFLALRAMQGEKLLDNSLDEFSRQQITKDAEAMFGEAFNSVEEAWLETVQEIMQMITNRRERKKIDIESLDLNFETIKLVREKSQWDIATEQIKDYVFKTKAWSVLIDLGCEPIIKTLEGTENSLKIAEDNAQTRQEEAEKQWNIARAKLNEFTTESQQIIEDYIDDNWERIFAKSFWDDVCIPSLELTANNAAPKVLDETTFLKGLKDGWDRITNLFKKDDDKETLISERIADIIKKELESSLSQKSQGWFNNLKVGGNPVYVTKILPKLKRACQQLQKEWNILELNYNSYLKGLDINIPQFSGNIRRDLDKYQEGFDNAVNGAISEGYFASWMTYITAVFNLMIIDIVFPGIGTLLTTIALAIIGLFAILKSREERIENISNKITEELNKGFEENQDEIQDKLENKLSIIRCSYSEAIQNSFKIISQQLERRIAEAQRQLNSDQVERDRIAEVAKEFRIKKIEPLEEEMEQLRNSVEKIWQKPS
ncbi:MAG: dynamin family protein [Cyanobacteria bacterium P01_A01_bin.83]